MKVMKSWQNASQWNDCGCCKRFFNEIPPWIFHV